MKFRLDVAEGQYQIDFYQAGKCISVNRIEYAHSIILTAQQILPWSPNSFNDLNNDHFAQLLTFKQTFVVFGSGEKHQFPHPSLLTDFYTTGTAIEIMRTDAACRTFNLLMAENRSVTAALLL